MNIQKTAKASLALFAFLILPNLFTVKANEKSDTMLINKEHQVAVSRLEGLSLNMEAALMYNAPDLAEDIEAYETNAAFERLENLCLTMENSVSYHPSAVNEEIAAYELAEAMERINNLVRKAEMALCYDPYGQIEQGEVTPEQVYRNSRDYREPAFHMANKMMLTR